MRRWSQLPLILTLMFAAPAVAQLPWGQPASSTGSACGVSSPYSGPGDIVSGALFWGGLRAYNNAYATGCFKALRIERVADGTQQDILIKVTGDLDIAAANTFAGNDATCTGTIAGTTLSVSSCSSGTLVVNDTLTGSGIVQPAYIASIGSCAAPPGTCTLNASQTVPAPQTITAQKALVIVTFYDQSGANNCSGACDATVGHQQAPMLLPDCGGRPCALFVGIASDPVTPSGAWPNPPYTVSTVAGRTGRFGSFGWIQGWNLSTNTGVTFSTSNNTVEFFMSATPTATASDNVVHAFQFVVNGASSDLNVDGTTNTVNVGAAINPGTNQLTFGQNEFGSQLFGYLNELGLWPGAFNGTQKTNSCHSQFIYWSTPNPC